MEKPEVRRAHPYESRCSSLAFCSHGLLIGVVKGLFPVTSSSTGSRRFPLLKVANSNSCTINRLCWVAPGFWVKYSHSWGVQIIRIGSGLISAYASVMVCCYWFFRRHRFCVCPPKGQCKCTIGLYNKTVSSVYAKFSLNYVLWNIGDTQDNFTWEVINNDFWCCHALIFNVH